MDWAGSALVVAGLAMFLVVAQPGSGSADISGRAWAVLLSATMVPAGCLALGGRATRGPLSAGLLGTSGGVIYGMSAALTKVVGHLLDGGVLHALSAWQPYALVVLGLGGMVVIQSAFQAGPLAWSLPAVTVVDPVVSIIIGAFAFGEHVAPGPVSLVLELVGLVAVVAGVFALASGRWLPGTPQGGDAGARVAGATRGIERGRAMEPRRRSQPDAAVEAVASPRSARTGPIRSSKFSL